MDFVLEMRKEGATPADTPVPHQFGTAFVVMADEEQSLMAAMTLDGVVYVFMLRSLVFTDLLNHSLEGSVIHTTTVAESDRECVECSKRFAKNSGGCEIM